MLVPKKEVFHDVLVRLGGPRGDEIPASSDFSGVAAIFRMFRGFSCVGNCFHLWSWRHGTFRALLFEKETGKEYGARTDMAVLGVEGVYFVILQGGWIASEKTHG